MKTTIQLKEIAMLGLGIYLFSLLSFSWWLFLVLFLTSNIGMLDYAINNKTGIFCCTILNDKGLAILIYFTAMYVSNEYLQFSGIILFSHTIFDRVLRYGLKSEKEFKFTHLGEIGKKN